LSSGADCARAPTPRIACSCSRQIRSGVKRSFPMDWMWLVVVVVLLIAWRMVPSFIEGYRGRKGGFFGAVGGALARKLKH